MHNCTYWYIPNRLEKSDILIYRISREDTILIETKSVKTKTWPFTATLTGYTNNSIIKKIELANLSLSVQSLNTGLSAIATINSFEITIVRKENIIYHKKLDDVDAKLYRHSQEELEIVKEGDYINYSNILYRLGEHLIPVEPLRIKLE